MKSSQLSSNEYHKLIMNYKENYHLCVFKGYDPERAVVCRNDGRGAFEIFGGPFYSDDVIIEALIEIEGKFMDCQNDLYQQLEDASCLDEKEEMVTISKKEYDDLKEKEWMYKGLQK